MQRPNQNQHMQIVIGIDIAKDTFDVAVLLPEQTPVRRKLPNDANGYRELNKLVAGHDPLAISVAMEATGTYGDGLAQFCFQQGWTVFVLNPARVKAYATAVGQKNKTDRADALTIGRFAQKTADLMPWAPLGPAQAQLRQLVRERLYLKQLIVAEHARRQTAGASMQKTIQARVELFQKQDKELWTRIRKLIRQDAKLAQASKLIASIPALGAWTAAILLSELPAIDKKTSARQIAALFGLCPSIRESGTSVRGRSRLSHGRALVRKQLYMPAVVALKHNPLCRDWAQKLRARGKTGKQVLAAVMHRLLRLVVGVLKHQTPFDPSWKGVRA